jgi:hypothetical protein
MSGCCNGLMLLGIGLIKSRRLWLGNIPRQQSEQHANANDSAVLQKTPPTENKRMGR